MSEGELLRHEIEVLEAWAPKLLGREWTNFAKRGTSNATIGDLDFHLRQLRSRLRRIEKNSRETAQRFVSQNL